MKYRHFAWCALAGILASANLMAQTSAPAATTIPGATSGMIGVAFDQTARLNVLNLNPDAGTPTVCSVQLEFVDAQNNVLKQSIVANIPPGQAVALDLRREDIAAATPARLEVRGVVRSPAILPPATASGSPNIPVGPACKVAANVETFDDANGATLAIVGVVHPLPASPVPVPAAN